MERYLNGEPIPESWREATIWPIHKNGSMKLAENYRGITLSNSVYKLYASILNSRLEEFTERENILQDKQNGFRKMRCTIDNIYILNHCVTKSIFKRQKLYAFLRTSGPHLILSIDLSCLNTLIELKHHNILSRPLLTYIDALR